MFGASITAQASYYETWKVEAEVLEVFDQVKTAAVLKKHPEMQAEKGKRHTGMKIRLTRCTWVEGHGKVRCKAGQEIVIVAHHEGKKAAGEIEPGMKLSLKYFYSNSAVPAGHPSDSHYWQLTAVK